MIMKNKPLDLSDTAVQPAIRAIHGYGGTSVYLIGGAVRDKIMGRQPKDQDFLVTGIPMDKMIDVLNCLGHADAVGQSFGVVKFRPFDSHDEYDFALPRTERSTGGGHTDFEVTADPFMSVEEDLKRRDFTINSIGVDLSTGEIIDPYGGVQDCRNKILRLVFPGAFSDDPLRMLRAIQFAARMGLRFDYELSSSMKAHAGLITSVSPERISMELCKLLTADKPSLGFALMRSHGLLKLILPELDALSGVPQPKKYHRYDVFSHSLVACDKIPVKGKNAVYLRLTALLHDIGKKATLTFKDDGTPQFLGHDDVGADMVLDILTRLRFTSVPGHFIPADRIVSLIRNHMFDCDCESSPRTLRRFVAKVGKNSILDQIRLRVADRLAKGLGVDVSEWVRFARQLRVLGHGSVAFNLKSMKVNGTEIMNHLGLKPGKKVGVILNALFQRVLDDPEVNNRDTLLGLASQIEA